MILGIIILKKRYSLKEYFSIFCITVGIIICTLASTSDIKKPIDNGHESNEFVDFLWWIIGNLKIIFMYTLREDEFFFKEF